MKKSGLALLMLGLMMFPIVVAQATWISGYVKDAEGKPVASGIVKARGVFETSTITDASGYYKLGLSAGDWTVTASYGTVEQAATIILADGEHRIVDFTMGTYVTVRTTTNGSVTFTGYTTYYPGTTITATIKNVEPSPTPSPDYWWLVVVGVIFILAIALALAIRKRLASPISQAKIEPPRKEAVPTVPTVVKKGVTCPACGYNNPPYAANYCVNCGARLK